MITPRIYYFSLPTSTPDAPKTGLIELRVQPLQHFIDSTDLGYNAPLFCVILIISKFCNFIKPNTISKLPDDGAEVP
jgi:hypothetical protein